MDWTDDKQVVEAIVDQFRFNLVVLAHTRDLEDLVNGYMSSRYKFELSREGLLLLELDEGKT